MSNLVFLNNTFWTTDPRGGLIHEYIMKRTRPDQPPTRPVAGFNNAQEGAAFEAIRSALIGEQVVWKESVKSRLANASAFRRHHSRNDDGLSQAEWELFVRQVAPWADEKQVPRPTYCRYEDQLHRVALVPRHRRVVRQVSSEVSRDDATPGSVVRIIGAMLYLEHLGDEAADMEPGDRVRNVRTSIREIAELLHCDHSYVSRTIRTYGGEEITTTFTARPSHGAGAGKDKNGHRRGTSAHPTNAYTVIVTEKALELARELHAALGVPSRARHADVLPRELFDAEAAIEQQRRAEAEATLSIDIPDDAPLGKKLAVHKTAAPGVPMEPRIRQLRPLIHREAARTWLDIKDRLRYVGLRASTITYRYGNLIPTKWDGQTLVLSGTVTDLALSALRRRIPDIQFQIKQRVSIPLTPAPVAV